MGYGAKQGVAQPLFIGPAAIAGTLFGEKGPFQGQGSLGGEGIKQLPLIGFRPSRSAFG
jgi:hypothetical protein